MADTPEDSPPDVTFWSSYRFCIDPRHCTIEVLPDQPQERSPIVVPAEQWRALQDSVTLAELDLMYRESGQDERLRLKQKIEEADEQARKLNPPYEEGLRRAIASAGNPSSLSRGLGIDAAKQARAEQEQVKHAQVKACKDYAEWMAKNRIDEATGEPVPWLREPDVQRGIRFAYETEDEGFFRRLGRSLSDKPKPSKRAPVMRLFAKNWIVGELPLAIFTDDALAGLCSCMAEQWGEDNAFDKDSISQRREDYRLQNLGSIHLQKAELGLTRTVGAVIKNVRRVGVTPVLIASSQIISAARTDLRFPRTKKPQRNS